MKLHQLFSYFSTSQTGDSARDALFQRTVQSIHFDAREVGADSVFVALKGNSRDGHDFLPQAIANGAIALVVENKSKVPENYPHFVLEVADCRQFLDVLAARFYDFPSQDLFCLGVTGTNGKTSITYLLEHILNHYHKKTGVMGTVNHRVGSQIWPSDMTTPDPLTLQRRLREFLDEGAQMAALEVSSHALDQRRAHSVQFNTVVFTNLTHDHLDYHKNMTDYFAAKQKLFTDLMWLTSKKPKFAVINIDDSYGRRLKVADEVIAWTYGKKESDFQFEIHNMNFNETEFSVKTAIDNIRVTLPVTGEHTIYNVVASAAAALSAGISLPQSFAALKDFNGIPGRLQRVLSPSPKTVFVDYAHTPDALRNVLESLRKVRKTSQLKSRILTVFGCGGDRDKTKRPLMAAVAAELSDEVFITSDNPRTEDPHAIIADIVKGLSGAYQTVIEADRERAIQKAIISAGSGDVVLIAGKGHEDYQIVGTEKRHFSDSEVALKYL